MPRKSSAATPRTNPSPSWKSSARRRNACSGYRGPSLQVSCRGLCRLDIGVNEASLREQRQIAPLFVLDFVDCLLQLNKSHRGNRVIRRDTNALRVLQREHAPDLFRAGKIVARSRSVIGAHIVGLPLECDTEGTRAHLAENSGKDPPGGDAAERDAGISDRAAEPANDGVRAPLVHMA